MTKLILLYETARRDSIPIIPFAMNHESAFSYMDSSDGQCYIAIDYARILSVVDEIMKVAHELGHCETGSFYNVWSSCDVRKQHENRADKWAIKMLIPKDELDQAVREGCTEVWDLADRFDVTEDFIRKAVSWYKFGNLYQCFV